MLLALTHSACAGGGAPRGGPMPSRPVPVCVDGTAIEVEGPLCEHAERGCNGEKQYWLPAVFVGPAGVSARLPAGGTDVQGDGREQLDRAAAPRRVGLRAASGAGMIR